MKTITNIAYGDAQTRGLLRHWKKKLESESVSPLLERTLTRDPL